MYTLPSPVPSPPSPTLELTLIPEFALRRDGEPVEVTPSCRRLLALLAIQPRPVGRAYVSGTLWGDADEQHASGCLRSTLWRLHRLGLISPSATQLWLDPMVGVDLRRVIEAAVRVLRAAPSDEIALAATHELIDAGDDVLTGWYDDWVVVERERFRQLRLHAMDALGERLIDAGRWYDALQVALVVTGAEPLRESAQRLLIRVHLAQGNIAEAIRQYRGFAELLRRELNTVPSAGIRALLVPYAPRATA